MKRKLLSFLAVMTVLFFIVSCSTETSTTQPSTTQPTGTATSGTETSAPTTTPEPGDVETGYYNLADYESQTGKKLESFNESPVLAKKVQSGDLPPVEERLPDNPLVFRTMDVVGEYGGTLRLNSINVDQDWHLRHLNAGNLLECPPDAAWDPISTVFGAPRQPGVLESYSMSPDGKVFTGTIRKGLKWSDGAPVTTEDVAFKINDVLLNEDLSPVPAKWLTWGGGTTKLEIVDNFTFQFEFAEPYGAFVEAQITLWPGTFSRMMLPKHYLMQYHKSYADEAELLKLMAENEYSSLDEWPEFFGKKVALFGCDNTFMDNGKVVPTLNPWVFVEDLGNGNYRLERNPYYHMVDQEGNQLPYIDQIKKTYLSDSEMENMSIIAGNTDLSCMSISIDNYPLYKENEAKGNYTAMALSAPQDQLFIICFNDWAGIPPLKLKSIGVNVGERDLDESAYDPGISTVYSDVRFRRAMSLALDRKTMNEALFMGLGRPAQVAPRPGSPYYEEGMEESYAEYDPEQAKMLLDEMGMKDVDGDGWRERPDGKPFTMKYDYFVISGASTPGSELCKRYWEDVGVRVTLKLVDVGYWFESLMPNNLNEATCWWLGGADANMLQDYFLGPSMIVPFWGNYTAYKGKVSDEDWQLILKYVPEWQRHMQDLRLQMRVEPDPQKRDEIGTKIWRIVAEWLPIIGVVADAKAPLIISADIGNVEFVPERNYNFITVMENGECLYFKNPARRAD